MAWSGVWVLGWLFGLVLAQSVLTVEMQQLCRAVKVMNSSLVFKERVHFMRHNMPINFTIKIHYEEVFKLRNVSRLRRNLQDQDLQDVDLQETWLRVNLGILKKIKNLLPRKHPSYNYTADLETLLLSVEQVFTDLKEQREPRESPERIGNIWEALATPLGKRRTEATPKSLLDNCYHTMLCVFHSCFPSVDYCQRAFWRNEKKAQVTPTPPLSSTDITTGKAGQ
ncbi:interleukin-34 [Sardina pilchardus]|uniref:interleukin-34 n=1 Tax=Sardina pilchardus TaxID=27697 RepID=UPI002E1210B5